MSTFRYKADKSKKGSSIKEGTLDIKHMEKMKVFTNQKKDLPKLKQRLNTKCKKLQTLEEKKTKQMTQKEVFDRAELKQHIQQLKVEINKVENNQDEIEYFANTSDILCDYYDILKEKSSSNSQQGSIMDFFNRKKPIIKKQTPKSNRADLYNQYLSVTSPGTQKTNTKSAIQICEKCNIEKTLMTTDGTLVCTGCGDTEFVIVDSDKPNFKEPIPDNTAYAYKRINHFNEWLSQFQAKESTQIPNEIYEEILLEIHKSRITNLAILTPEKMRQILKKLRFNKYYEHIPHIINKLNGIPPPNMGRETEEKLRQMFRDIQEPFTLFCPKDRKNFLSYSYVLHKFCQLLELDDFLQCFPLLKSREKLQQQDLIWKKICKHLNWQYISSI